jgi:redox-sensitive bicupin YhaK (pirin superfamily)
MWVPPDTNGLAPGYEQVDVSADVKPDELFALASGRETNSAIHINQRDATLWVARLSPGASANVPDAPFVHVFVARGGIDLESSGSLDEGDAARLTAAGNRTMTAADRGAEVVVWETHAEVVPR